MDWVMSAAVASGVVIAAFIIAWQFFPQGWRTVAFNALTIAATVAGPVIEHLVAVPWHEVFDQQTAFFIVLFINVANIAFRSMTTTPVGVR